MRCSVCGHESPPGSSFCLNCGSALAPAIAQTPGPAAGLPVICPSCRGENPPGMRFCRSCGVSLATAPSVAPFGAPAGALVTTPGTGLRGGAATPATVICPRCGTATPSGFAFCQQCGFQVQAAAPPQTAQPLPPPPAPPTAQPLPPPPSLPTAPPLPPAPTAPPAAEARARPPSRP